MIPKKVLSFNLEGLTNWLKYDAGSSNPDYFGAIRKHEGSLKLQQVPEEYSRLLLLMKSHKAKSYLELGIGNGGSFAMACFMMQETLENADAVDCLAYRNLGIGQNEIEILNFIENIKPFMKTQFVDFHNETTDDFFETNEKKYDLIMVDADHSYEGVRKDFVNAQKHINENGLIIFHDIASKACPGIIRIWKEIKSEVPEMCTEFIHGENCGIGVLKC